MNKPVAPDEVKRNAQKADGPHDLGPSSGKEPASNAEPPAHDVLDLRAPEDQESQEERKPDGDNDPAAKGAEARKSGDDENKTDETEHHPAPEGGRDEGDKPADEAPPKPPSKKVFVIVGLVLLACLAYGAYAHWRNYSESKHTAADTLDRPYDVRTVAAQLEDGPMDINLPGETDAFDTASIYARATGYISERRVDIGTRVHAGDLLAHIAAPDLDNQLRQAEAQLGQTEAALVQARTQVTQANANVNLAKVTFARTNQLTQQGYETLQNRDQQQASVETSQAAVQAAEAGVNLAQANVKAQQATVDRLRSLTSFENVIAPFDGVITSRNVDKGDLVSADTSTGTPMFTMSKDSTIRVTIRVPQNAAIGILDGLEATVHVPQMPDHPFEGRVARTSGALLYSSRSLTTEVDVPNPDGVLRSGLYVVVDVKIPREHPNVTVPAEAIIFNQLGMQVATVENGKAKLHSVTVFRDHGTSIELRDGLKGGEPVILSPPATLAEGSKVNETKEEDAKKSESQKGGDVPKPGATDKKPSNSSGNGDQDGGGKAGGGK